MKSCIRCGGTDRYKPRSSTLIGNCKKCGRDACRKWNAKNSSTRKASWTAWRLANPDKVRAKEFKRKYGLTIAQYDAMLKLQNGVCAICGNPPKTRRLAVEHDHGPSKRVRGLVDFRCNKYRIGLNTVESAKKVLKYLQSRFDGRNL